MCERLILKFKGVPYFTVSLIKKHFWSKPVPSLEKLREVMESVNVDCLNHPPKMDPTILKLLCKGNPFLYEILLSADHYTHLLFLDTLRERDLMVLCSHCEGCETRLTNDVKCVSSWQRNKAVVFIDSSGTIKHKDTIIHDPVYLPSKRGLIGAGN